MQKKNPPLWVALVPVVFLIAVLGFNVYVFGDDSLGGSNQMVLIVSGALAALLGMRYGTKMDEIVESITQNIKDTAKPIIILLLIGALAGTWLLGGIIPAMIFYGLKLLNPTIFLAACLVICAIVSVATGSSWSTAATIGIALVGVGKAMGLHEGVVAGAIISGAYFGDKLSPLSDTTNLAPAMAGTDLFTHIRYMTITTVPSVVIALLIFIAIGFFNTGELAAEGVLAVTQELEALFDINLWLFLVPLGVIALIIKKTDPLVALLAGVLGGAVCALIFQPHRVAALTDGTGSYFYDTYKALMLSMTTDTAVPSTNPMLDELLSSSGMKGMLNTVWLIITAMVFGGAMEASGFLKTITTSMLNLAKSRFSLIFSTGATCGLVNITTSDQYLSIVVPGKMFKDAYKDRNLAPENLSRTLEDTGTVTSVLVPWNTCGAYQSSVLGVATLTYLPFAFFNLISPLMTLFVAAVGYKIKMRNEGEISDS